MTFRNMDGWRKLGEDYVSVVLRGAKMGWRKRTEQGPIFAFEFHLPQTDTLPLKRYTLVVPVQGEVGCEIKLDLPRCATEGQVKRAEDLLLSMAVAMKYGLEGVLYGDSHW